MRDLMPEDETVETERDETRRLDGVASYRYDGIGIGIGVRMVSACIMHRASCVPSNVEGCTQNAQGPSFNVQASGLRPQDTHGAAETARVYVHTPRA